MICEHCKKDGPNVEEVQNKIDDILEGGKATIALCDDCYGEWLYEI